MTETKTPFPERMHKQAVETHTRRADQALKNLAYEIDVLTRRLGNGSVEADDVRKAAQLVNDLSGHFGSLEMLRDVREWDEAERTGEPQKIELIQVEPKKIVSGSARQRVAARETTQTGEQT